MKWYSKLMVWAAVIALVIGFVAGAAAWDPDNEDTPPPPTCIYGPDEGWVCPGGASCADIVCGECYSCAYGLSGPHCEWDAEECGVLN